MRDNLPVERLRLALRITGSTAVLALCAAPALAQESAGADQQEIIVTATKRDAPVQDIPMSISVIGSQEIERRGLVGMEDYLRSLPGVAQIDQGPRGNAIAIRGINVSPEGENFVSGATVGIYFGEASITGAGGIGAGAIDIRPVDVQRIEVLRGPQGTAFGSASLGGTVRILPAPPALDEVEGRAAASLSYTERAGSEGWTAQGVLNVPLVQDRLGVRAVAYRYEDSGFYRNIAGTDPATLARTTTFNQGPLLAGYFQDDVGRIRTVGGRLTLLWRPADNFDLTVTGLTQEIEQDGSPVSDRGSYAQARAPISPEGRIRGERGEAADTQIDLLNATATYRLGSVALTSTATWINSGSGWANDIFGLPYITSTFVNSDYESFTTETRVSADIGQRFSILAGVYFENIDERFSQARVYPGPPSPFGANLLVETRIGRALEQRAVFGQASFQLTNALTVTAGGRYYEYEREQRTARDGVLVGIPNGAGVPSIIQSELNGDTLSASLRYEPNADTNLYATWSQGFRLGQPQSVDTLRAVCDADRNGVIDGSNIDISSLETIASDSLDNYEIGGKFRFLQRRLQVEVAAFRIDWDGLPILTATQGCGVSYTANVGRARSEGVEMQARFQAGSAVAINFSASYINARLVSDAPSINAFSGDRLPGSPRFNASIGTEYGFQVGNHAAFVRVDTLYVGPFFGNLQRTPNTRSGDYLKLDARVGVNIRDLRLEAFVRNITNEDAFTWHSPALIGVSPGYQLRPRTFGVEIGYSF